MNSSRTSAASAASPPVSDSSTDGSMAAPESAAGAGAGCFRGLRRRRPLEMRQPLAQLAREKRDRRRLGGEVVHARDARLLRLALHDARGQGEDRDAPVAGIALLRADRASEIEAVHVGHVEVRQHERVVAAAPALEALRAVGSGVGLKADRVELRAQYGPVDRMVLHDEHEASLPHGLLARRQRAARGHAPGQASHRRLDLLRVALGERQRQAHRRALADGALERDVAAHEHREALADDQAQARPAVAPACRALRLRELREQARLLLGVDPDAGVADGDLDVLRVALCHPRGVRRPRSRRPP